MGQVDPRVDAYIEKAPAFAQPMLARIRKAFHDGCPAVVETTKWSAPAFEHHGLLGTMAAFKNHVSYGFWRGKDIEDPEGLFATVGASTMCAAKPTALQDLPTQRVLAGYVRRAAALNETLDGSGAQTKGRAQTLKKPAPRAPADLTRALKANAAAKATYGALAPSHKREYVEWILEAKREVTRAKRVGTAVEWLAQGKRRNWMYERRPS